MLTHKKSLSDNSPSLAESLKTNFKIEDDEFLKEGIVHRLDIDTSGIIIIAKNKETKILFQNKFKIGS